MKPKIKLTIEITVAEYSKLHLLGSDMNDRTPEQVARGIVGVYLEERGIVGAGGRPRNHGSCRSAMELAYKLYKLRGKRFSFEGLAEVYQNQWPVHAIRSRLSTMRAAGELNYRKVAKGSFEFTDV